MEHYLATNSCDPLSRQPLPDKKLTPVWALKSRALEYREATARACLDRACSPSPGGDPVRCLRRAVELSADAGLLPQGLPADVAAYVASHPSNAYDRLALEALARGLGEAGYRQRAAAVWFHLLATEGDRAQQAAHLWRCLGCWGEQGGGGAAPAVDDHACAQLAALLDRGSPPGWVLEVAAEAGLGDDFCARLCGALLFPAPALAGGGEAEALPWESEKRLLVTYTRVLGASLKARQGEAEARLERLEGGRGAGWAGGQARAVGGGRGVVAVRRPRWFGHPVFVLAACVLAAAAGDGAPPAVRRAARVLPLLALLPE